MVRNSNLLLFTLSQILVFVEVPDTGSQNGTSILCKFWIEDIVKWWMYAICRRIVMFNIYLNYSATEQ